MRMNRALSIQKSKNVNIELIRIIGCTLVIARHVFTAINFEAPGVLKGLAYTFTINGVSLFWLIMGFYLFHSNYDFIKKVKSTAIKIVVPAMLLTCISVFVFPWILGEMSFTQSISRHIGIRDFFSLVFVNSEEMKIVDHLWYVWWYVQVILWSPLLWYICREGKKEEIVRRYLISFEFISILFADIQYLLQQEKIITIPLRIDTPINEIVLYVLLGYELSIWLKSDKSEAVSQWKIAIGYLLFVLCVAGLEYICKIRNLQREYYNHSSVSFFIVATVFLFIVLYRINIKEKFRAAIIYLGDKTFYMYLIHYCIARKMNKGIINNIDLGEKLGLVKYGICVLITWSLALMMAIIIKKLECISKKVLKKGYRLLR